MTVTPDRSEADRSRLARASSLAMDPAEYADVPPEVEARIRSLCLALPESTEKQAWAGTQWRIRNKMFAHVITVDFPDGSTTALVFRAAGPELDALRSSGDPYFQPAWGADAVGMVLGPEVSWDEVTELVTDSYCAVAPKKLVALLDRPTG